MKFKMHFRDRLHPDIIKYLLIMKLSLFLMLAFSLTALSEGFSQVNITVHKAPLVEVLKEIRKQTGYAFLFNLDHLKQAKEVTAKIDNGSLEESLKVVFKDQPFRYEITGKSIILKLDRSLKIIQSEVPIKGLILGSDWQQIARVTVAVQGSKKGTMSSPDGTFNISVSVGDVLELSSMGLVTIKLRYTGVDFQDITDKNVDQNINDSLEIEAKYSRLVGSSSSNLQVQMVESKSPLDEVQIMAYGTTSKRVSTGNITKVSGEDLNMAAVTNPLLALQGRVPGMIVTPSNSNVPGAPVKIQIRGRTQVDGTHGASEEPLFIVDGVPVATQNASINMDGVFKSISPFSLMNMGDIESVEVLKDADATAIYGSRGASGVVLITTKKGKPGSSKLDVNFSTGGSKIPLPKMLSTKEYIQYRKEAFSNDKVAMTQANAYDLLVWDTIRNDNVLDQLLGGTAAFTNVKTTISGGASNILYNIGAGFNRQTDMSPKPLPTTNLSLHSNFTTTTNNKKFTFNLNSSFSHNKNKQSDFNMASVIELPPNFKLYEEDGSIAWNEGDYFAGVVNPLSQLERTNQTISQSYQLSSFLSYSVLPGLTFKTNIGYNQSKAKSLAITPIVSLNPKGNDKTGITHWGDNSFTSYNIDPQIEYVQSNILNGNLTILLGGSFQNTKNEGTGLTATGYTNDDYLGTYVGLTANNFTFPRYTFSDYKYAAGFARVLYNVKNTYMLSLSGRRDGSSRFGPNFRYSNFGSIGTAWVISEETFFPKNSFISFAKLRGSYGITGNDKIGDYKFLDLYENSFFNGPYNNEVAMTPASFFKSDLHWEMNKKLEFGLDGALFKDRLSFTLAWYRNRSSDPLVQYPLPFLTGFGSVTANLHNVIVENRGVELSVGGVALKQRNFEWRTNFNITVPHNELKRFDGLENTSYTSYKIGHSLNILYKLNYLGVDPNTGLYTVEDVNQDGKIDVSNPGVDMLYYGTSDPNFYGGWQNDLRYKQFNLSFFFNFNRQFQDNYERGTATLTPGIRNINAYLMEQRWKQPGDITIIPRATQMPNSSSATQGNYVATFSDRLLDKLTEVNLSTVQASYSLPEKVVSRMKLSQASLFAQGQNLWSFYLDSKIGPQAGIGSRFPQRKTVTLGVHLLF